MNKTHFTSLTNLLPFSVLSKFASGGVFRDELFFFLAREKSAVMNLRQNNGYNLFNQCIRETLTVFFVFVSHSASHGVFTKGLWEEIFCRMYTGTKTDIMNCYFLRSLIKEGYHSVGQEVIFSFGLIADNQD